MCTAITMQTLKGDTFFGRTMDFSYPLHPEPYIIQKEYELDNALKTHRIYNRYRFMGIGQDISPVTLADGVNEAVFFNYMTQRIICQILLLHSLNNM